MAASLGAIDLRECVKKGVVGALGVIPGTIAAHPFDVIKIRMQTSTDSLRGAVVRIGAERGAVGFYGGLGSAIQQKMITCGPMFLVSEICTQGMQVTGMERGQACFVGSAISGYVTGFAAALSEYRKVLQSQRVPNPRGGTNWSYTDILRGSRGLGGMYGIARRLNGAGVRNGIFDSTFFGMQHVYQQKGLSPTESYGLAAATAVLMGYSLDMAVKQQMVVPPQKSPKSILSLIQDLYKGPSLVSSFVRAHRGINPKIVEFTINYSAIGFSSVYIVYMINYAFSRLE
ncbi:hypothetical protein AAMO2058_001597400 [Amorphochlora amoebiformis]